MSDRIQPPLNIMLVDDDTLVLEVTSMMLADEGHTVREAANGVDALEQLERSPSVDLVITDVNMPKMDGLTLANNIQQRWPSVPILLVSGRPQPGLFPVMTKPYGWSTLLDAVRNITSIPQRAAIAARV